MAGRYPGRGERLGRNAHPRLERPLLNPHAMQDYRQLAHLEQLKDAEINEAKRVLADETTTLLHGREAAAAHTAADWAFKAAGQLSTDLPTSEVSGAEFDSGVPLTKLVARVSLARPAFEARGSK